MVETDIDAGATSVAGPLWTIQDVSAYLAVPVGTLYQWRHKGQGPPFLRLGKHLRADPAAVRAWVHEQVA